MPNDILIVILILGVNNISDRVPSFNSSAKKMSAALTGIRQDGIAVVVGHCSSGHLCSMVNNKVVEILNRDWKQAFSESNVKWLMSRFIFFYLEKNPFLSRLTSLN